ncbi:TetR/AcrR family transcriptional regulator [Actinomycetospora sp. NBRC 106375]|uniref:TetR/AcrR family transcriptional regulator n=1 Tax=Actinomycetospora sp. NBRC 106375 TaxID=3032207 RepID=UPI0025578E24|nr:TetR/AcrR family transcriptional regulator [Actinomycetospora sp. NBRC 106375]
MADTPRAAPPAHAHRAEQVRETRARVLGAARELFVRRGYTGATVDAIALRAGVSPQTVYNVIGTKADVLKAVYDVALAGDDEPLAVGERPHAAAMAAAPDAATALHLYARVGRQMLERAGPLLTTVHIQAPGRDPHVRAFVETIERERALGTATTARFLADRFGLRAGLTVAEAGDILWTLTAPETADRLLRRCGWSLDRYEAWLARSMTESVLGTDV